VASTEQHDILASLNSLQYIVVDISLTDSTSPNYDFSIYRVRREMTQVRQTDRETFIFAIGRKESA
jgi:hypothetical protein